MSAFYIPEAFSVPYATIDQEHQGLIALLNALADCADGQQPPDRLAATIDRFVAGLRDHFASDEQAMRDADFPRLAQHVAIHRQCSAHVDAILGPAKAQGEIAYCAVVEVFTALIDLIARSDLYFKEHLVGTGRLAE